MNRKNKLINTNGNNRIKCNGDLMKFDEPLIMGILNVTPDSFYDGGKHLTEKAVLNSVDMMINDGAAIVDVGGMSTRPGAKFVDEKEEMKRVINAVKSIKKEFPQICISVDTFRAEVARAAINEGAGIINDISGGTFDDEMFKTVAGLDVPYIMMHIKGKPENMQKNPVEKNIADVVKEFFEERLGKLKELGFDKVILDPGFGFGKSLDCNYVLLKSLGEIKAYGYPVLAGISRKSMINKVLGTLPAGALNGTTVLNTIALMNGADILRVHDVKEAKQSVELYKKYISSMC